VKDMIVIGFKVGHSKKVVQRTSYQINDVIIFIKLLLSKHVEISFGLNGGACVFEVYSLTEES